MLRGEALLLKEVRALLRRDDRHDGGDRHKGEDAAMAVTNELAKPAGDGFFEEMCLALYRRAWKDSTAARVGRSGQRQFGVDILAFDGNRRVGIQCKNYPRKPFVLATVTDDVERADDAGLEIEHLLFATTAASKADLVIAVEKLSAARRKEGKFTVSVDFWDAIEGLLLWVNGRPGRDSL